MGAGESSLIDGTATEDQSTITFAINGKVYTINPKRGTGENDFHPEYKLVDFIRYKAGLKGTKYMCREGGCGCCCVTAKIKDATGNDVIKSVNSCLIPLFSCDGWDISTIESLGNKKKGYSNVQQRLAKFGGTQCGYCTPGMVMNMHSLLESKPVLEMKEIENSFDGNICRCTGFRPILDAFKSVATDAPEELKLKCYDIEDLPCAPCPSKTNLSMAVTKSRIIHSNDGRVWVTAVTLNDAFEAIQRLEQNGLPCRIVGGNTGTGIYKKDTRGMTSFLNVTKIPELQRVVIDQSGVVLGGAVTLATAIASLKRAGDLPGYQYAHGIAKHWGRIANTPVRNVATIAGNLMLKRLHPDFPSDIFATLESVGAEISIATSPTNHVQVSVLDFLQTDVTNKIVLAIHLKPLTPHHIYKSFKITRRFQNAHAYVNAAFCMKVDKKANYTVSGSPRIVFGNISNEFMHATLTEKFLVNKSLRDSQVIVGAMATLEQEIQPDSRPPDGSQVYRKRLAQSLLYKTILWILGPDASNKVRSGGKNLQRSVTKGQQTYDTDKCTWPISQPILKLESLPQISGEAEYINDIQPRHGELFGAYVLSTVASADISEIDASEAEEHPGVVKFVKASDIPGVNNYMVFAETPEEIFASNKVGYLGQPIGLIVAESRDLAFQATELVKVKYSNVSKGVMSIEEAMETLTEEEKNIDPTFPRDGGNAAPSLPRTHKITGEFQIGSQYHFHMETHVTICVPTEDGLDVFSSTQWMDLVQSAISVSLGIPCHEINVSVRRIGGAYGSKITRATQVACACAVAAHVIDRPVRVALDLETNMRMIGKRAPFIMKYEVEVDDAGRIVALKGKLFSDTGMEGGEETSEVVLWYLSQSLYDSKNWEIKPVNLSTNTPSNTWCRGPGATPAVALIENIMEHIAFVLKKDPLAVRLANVLEPRDAYVASDDSGRHKLPGENLIPRMLGELKISGDIEARKQLIEEFNRTNRWKKRGMALVPMCYPLDYYGPTKPKTAITFVSIFKTDGTVAVATSGIECGQGLNTKVAQAVAYALGIPIEKVKVKPSNNLVSPNSDSTGASMTSELCVFGALKCCEILNERMKPLREKNNNITWEALAKLSYEAGINLTATYLPGPKDKLSNYDIWVVNLTEVEIDCLTGETKVVRVDLIEDAGKSLNPEIDIGQVEGALVMGLGLWMTEKIIYGSDPPSLLTDNTWTYKPPLPKDLPEDLRITLLTNAPNPIGILRSKATGEPPLCSSVCVLFALKNAIYAARKDAGNNDWFQLDGPVTPEDVFLKSLTCSTHFTL